MRVLISTLIAAVALGAVATGANAYPWRHHWHHHHHWWHHHWH